MISLARAKASVVWLAQDDDFSCRRVSVEVDECLFFAGHCDDDRDYDHDFSRWKQRFLMEWG